MIGRICKGLKFSHVVTTEIWGSRKQSAAELAELFQENGCSDVFVETNVEEAFEKAYALKGEGLMDLTDVIDILKEMLKEQKTTQEK